MIVLKEVEETVAQTLIEIGQQVRDRRQSLRLTQAGLADLADCSTCFVGMVEGGKPTVRLDKLLDVLEAVGLELRATVRTVP